MALGVKPYVEKVCVTFPVAVDTAACSGAAFGLKHPVSDIRDEVVIVRLQGGGPRKELCRADRGTASKNRHTSAWQAPQVGSGVCPEELERRSPLPPTLEVARRSRSGLRLDRSAPTAISHL